MTGIPRLSPVDGGLPLGVDYATTPPTTPAAGLTLFSRTRYGAQRLGLVGAKGAVKELGVNLAAEGFACLQPLNNSTTLSLVGLATPTTGGTVTARAVDSTSFFTSQRRVGLVSAASASSSGSAIVAPGILRGSASGAGGFYAAVIGGISSYQSGMRLAMGVAGQIAANGSDPSTSLDCVLVGKDAADSNLQLMYNDGSGSCTKVDLGSSFPANTGGVDMYLAEVWCAPDDTVVYYCVTRLNTGDVAQGSLNTNLPTNTAALSMVCRANTGAGSVAVAADLCSFFVIGGRT